MSTMDQKRVGIHERSPTGLAQVKAPSAPYVPVSNLVTDLIGPLAALECAYGTFAGGLDSRFGTPI